MHFSSRITASAPSSRIAPDEQTLSHRPQPMQLFGHSVRASRPGSRFEQIT
jgi:hypothetical protein